MKKQFLFFLFFLTGFFYFSLLFGQEVIPDIIMEGDEKASDAFRSSQLIDVQTTAMPAKQGFEFHIRHRFGNVATDKTLITQFLGTDGIANIRFGFIFPLSEKIYVGVGRTKIGKTYDVEFKHLLISQTTDNRIPVSVAVYFDAAFMSDKFTVPTNAFYSDLVTPFHYKFNYRLSYNSQIIVSRNFSDKFSLQTAIVFIYKNLVSPGLENYTFSLPVSGMLRTGKFSSVIFEYAYRFNNPPAEKNIYPLSIAFEMGTVGHIFQIVLSSSKEILEQAVYTNESFDYKKGKFVIGFNIKRTFWYKKKKQS